MSTVFPGLQATGPWLRRLYDLGFAFPDNYLVIDTETTGRFPRKEFVVQFGHLRVVERVPQKPVSIMLGWPNCRAISREHFATRIRRVIADLGSEYKFSCALLSKYGRDPLPVLEIYLAWFRKHQAEGGYFVMHNGIHYDCPLIEAHFSRFLDQNFMFNPNQVVDTGLIEKAIQMDVYPEQGETMPDFYRRVYPVIIKDLRWNLSRHCIPKYGLDRRYNLPMELAHTAGFDCFMTHLLVEEYRRQAEI